LKSRNAAAGVAKFLFFFSLEMGLIVFVLCMSQREESIIQDGGRLIKKSDHFIQRPKHDRLPLFGIALVLVPF
jgi:hypothetical protein